MSYNLNPKLFFDFYNATNVLHSNKFSKKFIPYTFLVKENEEISLNDIIQAQNSEMPKKSRQLLKGKLFGWLGELSEEEGLKAVQLRLEWLKQHINSHFNRFSSPFYTQDQKGHSYPFLQKEQLYFDRLDLFYRLNSILKECLLRGKGCLPLKFDKMRSELQKGLKEILQSIVKPLKDQEVSWQRDVLSAIEKELESHPALYDDEVKEIVAAWKQQLEETNTPVSFPKWRHHTGTLKSTMSIACDAIRVRHLQTNQGAFVTSHSKPIEKAGTTYNERKHYGNYCFVMSGNIEIQAGYRCGSPEEIESQSSERHYCSPGITLSPLRVTYAMRKNRFWIGFQEAIAISSLENKTILSKLYRNNVSLLAVDGEEKRPIVQHALEKRRRELVAENYQIRLCYSVPRDGAKLTFKFSVQLDFIISLVIQNKLRQYARSYEVSLTRFDYVSDDNDYAEWESASEDEEEGGASIQDHDSDGAEELQEVEIYEQQSESILTQDTVLKREREFESFENEIPVPKRKREEKEEEDPEVTLDNHSENSVKQQSKKKFDRIESKMRMIDLLDRSIPQDRLDIASVCFNEPPENLLDIFLNAQQAVKKTKKRNERMAALSKKVTTFKIADQLTHLLRTALPFTLPNYWATLGR